MDDVIQDLAVSPDAIAAFESQLDVADRQENRSVFAPRPAHQIHQVPLMQQSPSEVRMFQNPGPVFDRARMVAEIRDRMDAAGSVGYSWAIAQNGVLVDAGGVGEARSSSETNPRPMRARTRMVSASLAKPVCALTVMKLVEEGTLELNQAAYPLIEGAFPNGHASLNGVTIEHLLTHRSGFNGPGQLSQFSGTLATALSAAPGTVSRYENWNYWFLAHVVEAVTGESFARFARQNVLLPMGIKRMTRNVNEDVRCLYYAAGSSADGRGWDDFEATAIGAYGWFGNAVQWAKFLVHFRFDTVLSSQTRHDMLDTDHSHFGFRFWRNQRRGTYYGHGGDFCTMGRAFHGGIMSFPDGIDAALLTNSDDVANPENVLISAYHAAYV